MKKFLAGLLLLIMMVSVTGCGNSVMLDLEKIKKDLNTLTTDEFYLQGVPSIVECESCTIFKNMEDVYDSDFKKLFGLNPQNIEGYIFRYNKKTKEMYAIFEPVKGKEETIQKEMEAYFNKKKANATNMASIQYEGYLIYVISSDNQKVIDMIKSSKASVFGAMVEVTKEQMKDILSLDSNKVSEFLMKMPMMNVQSSTYVIAKPVDGAKKEVQEALDQYMIKLEEQWKSYLPDQYELVRNRKVVELGDYLIYIISGENDLVLDTIKKNERKG